MKCARKKQKKNKLADQMKTSPSYFPYWIKMKRFGFSIVIHY